nr:MAG TPA: hypothetical protein [Caudoviricetes sp.]
MVIVQIKSISRSFLSVYRETSFSISIIQSFIVYFQAIYLLNIISKLNIIQLT